MSIIILIHGAWHGKWCWKKLTPLLREKGHTVDFLHNLNYATPNYKSQL
jgi:hypothetical protein